MFMRKLLLTLSLLFAGCLIYSGEILKINGKFNNWEKGKPAGWVLNKVLPGEINLEKNGRENIAKLTSAKRPFHIYSNHKIGAIAGEKIKISAKIKGSGKAILGIYLYAKNGAWIGTNLYHEIVAKPEWQQEQFIFELINFKVNKLAYIRIVLGAAKNSSIAITQLQAEMIDRSASVAATAKKQLLKKNSQLGITANSANIPINFTLPKIFYGVPGIESAIYLSNIMLPTPPSQYRLSVKPKLGKCLSDRWIIVPTATQVGTHQLTVAIIQKTAGKSLAHGTITLNIAPADAGAGKKLKLLIIGDSLTAANQYVMELARLLSQPGNPEWTMLGTQKKSKGVAHEGYSGWTWKAFSSKYVENSVNYTNKSSSPFIYDINGSPQLDVKRYFRERCNGVKPDVITILLGINDCFGLAKKLNNPTAVNAGIDQVFANAEKLLNALRAAAPKAIIGICVTPPPNIRESAFFANYKGSFSRWGWKQVQHILAKRQLKYFGNRQQDNIYIIPTELNIDCVAGYPNKNGVHPNTTGYKQLASTIYCWLKWQLYTNKGKLTQNIHLKWHRGNR